MTVTYEIHLRVSCPFSTLNPDHVKIRLVMISQPE